MKIERPIARPPPLHCVGSVQQVLCGETGLILECRASCQAARIYSMVLKLSQPIRVESEEEIGHGLRLDTAEEEIGHGLRLDNSDLDRYCLFVCLFVCLFN